MKITNLEKTEIKTIFTIEVDKNDWVNEQTNTRKQLAKELVIPGFRKGHVPLEKANSYISTSEVMNKAISSMIDKTIDKFYQSPKYLENKQIIDETLKIDIKDIDESKLIITLSFDNKPTITLPEYKSIKDLNYKKPEVTDQEINDELNRMTMADRSFAPKADNTIANGDMVTFDFKGFLGTEAFPGGEAADYRLEIGSHQFIPGFEEKMVGLKVGDKTKIDVTFPADYHAKELAGKPVTFELNIKKVETISKPTIDAGYIAKLNIPGVLNEIQLKEHIKSDIFRYKNYSEKQVAVKQITDFLAKNTKANYVPETILDKEINRLKSEIENQAKQKNKKIEEYIKEINYSSMDDFNNKIKAEATDHIMLALAIDKIINDLEIKVSNEEIEKEVNNIASIYHMGVAEVKKNSQFISHIINYLTQDKLFDKIIELNLMK